MHFPGYVLNSRGKREEEMKIFNIAGLAILIAAALVFQQPLTCKAQVTDAQLARTMEGHYLHNMLGMNLGKIRTVTFNRAGAPTSIVISVPGAKIRFIPFSALIRTSMKNHFVVNISERQLRRLPAYPIAVLNELPG